MTTRRMLITALIVLLAVALIVAATILTWAHYYQPPAIVCPALELPLPDYFPPAPLRLWWVEGTA